MKLQIKVRASDDFKSLIIKDITGIYSISNDGYGVPNPLVTDGVLTIKITDQAGFIYNLPNLIKTSLSPLPSNVGGELTILASDLGLGQLLDGLYTIDYIFTVGVVVYKTTYYYLNVANATCCVHAMKISIGDCKCKDRQDSLKPFEAQMYLDAAIYAWEQCQARNKATELLKLANDLCGEDCGCH